MRSFPLESYFDFKLFKKSLVGLSVGIWVFLPVDFFHAQQNGTGTEAQGSSLEGVSKAAGFQPLAFYENAFRSSSLFGTAVSEIGTAVFKSSLADLAKDYRLKGVVILDIPEAILEDARTQKTIFVKPGDSVGELQVKEIREGAIILTAYGEEKELRIE